MQVWLRCAPNDSRGNPWLPVLLRRLVQVQGTILQTEAKPHALPFQDRDVASVSPSEGLLDSIAAGFRGLLQCKFRDRFACRVLDSEKNGVGCLG